MSESQVKQYLEAMDRAARKYSASKETARAALVEAGIVDEKGELTEHYLPSNVQPSSEPHSRISRVR